MKSKLGDAVPGTQRARSNADESVQATNYVHLITNDERLKVSVQQCLPEAGGLELRCHTRPQELSGLTCCEQMAGILVDLTAVPSDQEVLAFLQRIAFQDCVGVPILVIVDREGYPFEIARMLDAVASVVLTKPIEVAELSLHLSRLEELRAAARFHAPPHVLCGKSVKLETRELALVSMLEDVRMVANHDVTVLLVGETGSGKTTLAKLFHELSPRHQSNFIHVACGALPPSLIESELFGHERGAFTGADRDKIGKFEAAGDGTLLLDEIDALDLEQQVKLLRVIELREFEPVGSNETRTVRARVIVASNVCLETLVANNRFRKDLYYRLNVLKFNLPPLRERILDVVPMAFSFVRHAAEKCSVKIARVKPDFVDAIKSYHWPGNLRELSNCMERAVVLCRNGTLSASCLPAAISQGARPSSSLREDVVVQPNQSLPHKVAESERIIIEEVLRKHNYRRGPAAEELGVSRVTLYNKMKKYGIHARTDGTATA
ncbi:MAG: sigma-54 dependent transcriptional regulator [Planctomycetota bacterium]